MLPSSKLVFQAKGGGSESVQSAAPTFTKERFCRIGTNRVATNRAVSNTVPTWNWRSLLAPATSLPSLR